MDLFICVKELVQVLSFGSCTRKVNLMVLQFLLRSPDEAVMTDMDKFPPIFLQGAPEFQSILSSFWYDYFCSGQDSGTDATQGCGCGIYFDFLTQTHTQTEVEAKMVAVWKCPGWRFYATTVYRDTMHSKPVINCERILIVMNRSG